MAPSDYYLFSKIRRELRGYPFVSGDDISAAVIHFLEVQDAKFYKKGIRLLGSGHVLIDQWEVLHKKVGGRRRKTDVVSKNIKHAELREVSWR